MDRIISFFQSVVHDAALAGIVLVELAGILILLITVIRSLREYFRSTGRVRLNLAQGIALSLEFKLGGEVLRTVVVREWTELAVLGAVILLRTALTLLLHWEIRIEEQRELEASEGKLV